MDLWRWEAELRFWMTFKMEPKGLVEGLDIGNERRKESKIIPRED